MSDAFQVLEDCPDCRVEGAVVALVDPDEAQGLSLSARCRLCGRRERMGRLRRAGQVFRSSADVITALVRWAEQEGQADVALFCAINMDGLRPEQVAQRVLRKERVATSFDVVAFLFPGMAAAMGGADPEDDPFAPTRSTDALPRGWPDQPEPDGQAPDAPGQESGRLDDGLPDGWPDPVADPSAAAEPADDSTRTAVRALAAVILADGLVSPREKRMLERICARAGYPPPSDADLRAWRPGELDLPENPEAVLDAMVALAHVDRQRDGSEWRVVREFARAWGYPLADLERRGQRAQAESSLPTDRLVGALQRILVRAPRRGPGAS